MANKTRKILLLPGDGIGPEVVAEVRKILEWMNKTKSLDFVLSQELIGGASIDANKVPITDEVFYKSLESDAVILVLVADLNGIIWNFQKNLKELF